MKRRQLLLISALTLVSVGCAGTKAIVKTPPPHLGHGDQFVLSLHVPAGTDPKAVGILRDRLQAQLSAHGLLANGNPANAKRLEVNVNHYEVRPGAGRALAGAFAGTDKIVSTTKIRDGAGRVLSDFSVESKNSTALWSVKGLLEDHADKIVKTLRSGH